MKYLFHRDVTARMAFGSANPCPHNHLPQPAVQPATQVFAALPTKVLNL
ncbi:MAG: hypothetical protein ACTTHD_06185 [Porphyromonas endodontalis]